MTDKNLCQTYDQISNRTCRYYAGHGGSHNFARLDHNYFLERALRCELDAMTKALAEAIELFDAVGTNIARDYAPTREQLARINELRKLVQR